MFKRPRHKTGEFIGLKDRYRRAPKIRNEVRGFFGNESTDTHEVEDRVRGEDGLWYYVFEGGRTFPVEWFDEPRSIYKLFSLSVLGSIVFQIFLALIGREDVDIQLLTSPQCHSTSILNLDTHLATILKDVDIQLLTSPQCHSTSILNLDTHLIKRIIIEFIIVAAIITILVIALILLDSLRKYLNKYRASTDEYEINRVSIQRDAETLPKKITGPFPDSQLDYPLFGRELEIETVLMSLVDNRLTVVTGFGGSGKTRLSAEVLAKAQFEAGVIWHQMGAQTTLSDLISLVRTHLLLDTTSTYAEVMSQFQFYQLLIVIDEGEECMDIQAYTDFISQINISGGTRVLLVSRSMWPTLSTSPVHLGRLKPDEASKMLLTLIKHTLPQSKIHDVSDRALEVVKAAYYHPGLIEYSVKWMSSYPVDEVLEMLSSLSGKDAQEALNDFIRSEINRLKTLSSRRLLTTLRKLTAFRGGLTIEAAHVLTENTAHLPTLMQWGFVTFDKNRYSVPTLVEKVVGMNQRVFDGHYAYYSQLITRCNKSQQYHLLEPEIENIKAAFIRKIERDQTREAFDLYKLCYSFLHVIGRFDLLLDWINRIGEQTTTRGDPEFQGDVHHVKGRLYQALPTGNKLDNIRLGIQECQHALNYRTPNNDAIGYAKTQNNLGLLFVNLSEFVDPIGNLNFAIEAFEEALLHKDSKHDTISYSATEENLGLAYWSLARIYDRRNNLHTAKLYYQSALEHRSLETVPLLHIQTLLNLGNTYAELASVEDRVNNLQQALEINSDAFNLTDLDNYPELYIVRWINYSYYNLLLDTRGGLTDSLKALFLVKRYQELANFPYLRAQIQYNLGCAFFVSASSLEGNQPLKHWPRSDLWHPVIRRAVSDLKRSVLYYEEAASFFLSAEDRGRYVKAQYSLSRAYLKLSTMTRYKKNLELAIEASDRALTRCDTTSMPLEYAEIRSNFGCIALEQGNLKIAIDNWAEAETIFRKMEHSEQADKMKSLIMRHNPA